MSLKSDQLELGSSIFLLLSDAGLEHMAALSRGNGTNFDWLR